VKINSFLVEKPEHKGRHNFDVSKPRKGNWIFGSLSCFALFVKGGQFHASPFPDSHRKPMALEHGRASDREMLAPFQRYD